MLEALYNFFAQNIFIASPTTNTGIYKFLTIQLTVGNTTMRVYEYLSSLGCIISIILILVLCCLFVYKIIKLIGGLIR